MQADGTKVARALPVEAGRNASFAGRAPIGFPTRGQGDAQGGHLGAVFSAPARQYCDLGHVIKGHILSGECDRPKGDDKSEGREYRASAEHAANLGIARSIGSHKTARHTLVWHMSLLIKRGISG